MCFNVLTDTCVYSMCHKYIFVKHNITCFLGIWCYMCFLLILKNCICVQLGCVAVWKWRLWFDWRLKIFFFGAVTLIEVNVINLSPKSNSFFFSEFDACNSPVYVWSPNICASLQFPHKPYCSTCTQNDWKISWWQG